MTVLLGPVVLIVFHPSYTSTALLIWDSLRITMNIWYSNYNPNSPWAKKESQIAENTYLDLVTFYEILL